jgi:hypothetical protein
VLEDTGRLFPGGPLAGAQQREHRPCKMAGAAGCSRPGRPAVEPAASGSAPSRPARSCCAAWIAGATRGKHGTESGSGAPLRRVFFDVTRGCVTPQTLLRYYYALIIVCFYPFLLFFNSIWQ